MEKLSIVTLLNSCLVTTLLFPLVDLASASTENSLEQFGKMLSPSDDQIDSTGVVVNIIEDPPKAYENPYLGMKFEYPRHWSIFDFADRDSCKPGSDKIFPCSATVYLNTPHALNLGNPILQITRDVEGDQNCECANLTDYLRYWHEVLVDHADESTTISDFHFIGDNQTTIGNNNHSVWQLQYRQIETDDDDFTSHNITTVYWITEINGTFDRFEFETSEKNFTKYYPVVKSILHSVEFIPSPPEKTPSFMSSAEESMLDVREQSDEPIRIEGLSSFTEPNSLVGNMLLVVGEVHNDSPETLTSVSAAITLYDRSENVVGTDITYTRPSSIAPGSSAPFKFTIFGDSIRGGVDEVEDYKVSVSSRQ